MSAPPHVESSNLSSEDDEKLNIHVFCRFRPLRDYELREKEEEECMCLSGNNTVVNVLNPRAQRDHIPFTFDRVYGPASTNEETYAESVQPMVEADLLNGVNVTVMAYGQTGSGKTWTMMGDSGTPSNAGVIPRLCGDLFSSIEKQSAKEGKTHTYSVEVSICEIYNEQIRDLLASGGGASGLKLVSENGETTVQGIKTVSCTQSSEAMAVLRTGEANRSVSATQMNSQSSRSHSIFMFKVAKTEADTNTTVMSSKLFLVDLAGSEKTAKSKVEGMHMTEANHINKSLSALGAVIRKLSSGNAQHIPYRDSKLTRLLRESLSGNSKTTMFITASPSIMNLEETVSTLRFGQRVKLIKTAPVTSMELTVGQCMTMLQHTITHIHAQQRVIDHLSPSSSSSSTSPSSSPSSSEIKLTVDTDPRNSVDTKIETESLDALCDGVTCCENETHDIEQKIQLYKDQVKIQQQQKRRTSVSSASSSSSSFTSPVRSRSRSRHSVTPRNDTSKQQQQRRKSTTRVLMSPQAAKTPRSTHRRASMVPGQSINPNTLTLTSQSSAGYGSTNKENSRAEPQLSYGDWMEMAAAAASKQHSDAQVVNLKSRIEQLSAQLAEEKAKSAKLVKAGVYWRQQRIYKKKQHAEERKLAMPSM